MNRIAPSVAIVEDYQSSRPNELTEEVEVDEDVVEHMATVHERFASPSPDIVEMLLQGATMVQITSREFNQDTRGAKKAAEKGPVYITDRGRRAHVLLTFEAYEELIGRHRVVDLLAKPAGIEDLEFTTPRSSERAAPARFD